MKNNMTNKIQYRGFTLVEIAIVLVIVGLIAGSLLPLLGGQIGEQRRKTTMNSLANVQQALTGFAISNGRLPCPDRTGDGLEDRNGANSCFAFNFNNDRLPAATLGVPATDPWGQTYRYRVTGNFADSTDGTGCVAPPIEPGLSFGSCSIGDINISDGAGVAVANSVPAIIFSLGENFSVANGASVEEAANQDNDTNFVSRGFRDTQAAAGGFDDLVVWVSRNALINQMVSAGRQL